MTGAMDELEARARAQLGRLAEFGDRLAAVSVRESSPDGLVTTEVDGSGALTGLWLAEGANDLGDVRLGEQIVATALLGAQRAFAARAELTEEFTAAFAEQLESR